jgi:hypothetical protein
MDEISAITCPACGHRPESHPMESDGSRTCSRVLNGLPSCEECAAPLRSLGVTNGSSQAQDDV